LYVITYICITCYSKVRGSVLQFVAQDAYGAADLMSIGTQSALRRLTVTVALLALLVASGLAAAHANAAKSPCDEAAQAPRQASLNDLRSSMLCLVNRVREHYGIEPLEENAPLRRSATGHSNDMVEHGYFSHDGPAGSTVGSRVTQSGYLARVNAYFIGENIGGGVGPKRGSALAVFRAWMHSPPHRANILDTEFHDLGVGVARGYPAGGGIAAATYTLDLGMRN
jgi:uncharacterized protein YkwD